MKTKREELEQKLINIEAVIRMLLDNGRSDERVAHLQRKQEQIVDAIIALEEAERA